jgi:prophage tail gpP-like protein
VSEIGVCLGDNIYTGWKEITVTRSMDDMVGEYELQAAERTTFKLSNWLVRMGDLAEIKIGNTPVITGYVEDIDPSYDSNGHRIRIAGRDKTADLVDCSRPEGDGAREWEETKINDVLQELLRPFNISLATVGSGVTTRLNRSAGFLFSVNEGETIFDTIMRLVAKAQVRPISLGDGKLTLVETGTTRATDGLERGVNILAGGLSSSDRDRFSDYFSKGQGLGLDERQVTDYTEPKGEATDTAVKRYRPFVSINDSADLFGNAQSTAQWEAAIRAGDSRKYNYTVLGWAQRDGLPWQLNSLVRVKDDTFDLDDSLLICGLVFSYDSSGTKTQIELCSPEKYKAEAELNKMITSFDDLFS